MLRFHAPRKKGCRFPAGFELFKFAAFVEIHGRGLRSGEVARRLRRICAPKMRKGSIGMPRRIQDLVGKELFFRGPREQSLASSLPGICIDSSVPSHRPSVRLAAADSAPLAVDEYNHRRRFRVKLGRVSTPDALVLLESMETRGGGSSGMRIGCAGGRK